MSRLTLFMTLLGLAQSAMLERSGKDGDGYCYAYEGGGKKWCWLVSDGKEKYIYDGDDGYSCASYDGYKVSDYCQDGGTTTHTGTDVSAAEPSGMGAAPTPAIKTEPADEKKADDCGAAGWTCPSSWTTGDATFAPSDAPDAKAFVAAHNIYRCMHDVQSVQWDKEVYDSAKGWAQSTGTTMKHSSSGTSDRPESDGENLAGTFKASKHPGVDATHMWYSEIEEPCGNAKSCFQSFNAGHFTAMIWKTVNKIAYSDTTGELAVGRYRGCDGTMWTSPNFNSAYAKNVPPPIHNWGECTTKVFACDAFKGLNDGVSKDAKDVDGCGEKSSPQVIWSSSKPGCGMDGPGCVVYKEGSGGKSSCGTKYADLTSKISRLYNIPEALQPLMSNPWPVAVACGCSFVIFLGMAVRRSWRRSDAASQDSELLSGEDSEGNLE